MYVLEAYEKASCIHLQGRAGLGYELAQAKVVALTSFCIVRQIISKLMALPNDFAYIGVFTLH